jgi:histidinol-phosphate aminotransferase
MIKPRENIRNLVRISEKKPSRMFKNRLDQNERNQPFSQKFIEDIKNEITGELFMVYPELDVVYDKMAKWLNIKNEQLMLHTGSDQAIKAVFETYIDPGDKVLLHYPGFAMYEVYCKMFQAQIVSQYFDSELNFDWDAYVKKITNDIRMVVVENPNGFLGVKTPMNKLNIIVQKAKKTGSLVLVDEAYYHFHNETALKWINKYDNLIIARTFSKALGLAGLRVGYLVSNSENIDYLRRVKPTFEITSFTALVVLEILKNSNELTSYIDDTKKNLKTLRQGFAELGISTSDSKANFIAVKLGNQRIHDELREALAEKDILIRRPFREENLKEWVRISSAEPQIQKIILEKTKEILKKYKE